MSLVVPFQRTAAGAAIPSCSRIPHIQFHIIRKQFQNRISRKETPSTGLRQIRPQSTLVIDSTATETSENSERLKWKTLNPFGERPKAVSAEDGDDLIATNLDGVPARKVKKTEAFQNVIDPFDRILKRGDPDQILLFLATTLAGNEFVNEATNEEFERAVCALDTDSLSEAFRQRQWFSRADNQDRGIMPMNKTLVARMRRFEYQLDCILTKRLEAGHRLTLPVCRHMLKCAGSIGSINMAQQILSDLMPGFGLSPDLACYNNFLRALNWNRCFGEKARFSLRMAKFSLDMRTRADRWGRFRGYVVSGFERGKQVSIRNRALNAFQKLVNDGFVADESTFANLMIAMAREADITAVESILKSVWHIDVPMLAAFDEEEIESPTFYEEGHHLRPSNVLLFAVVHSYCINNKPGKAWILVDYISRNYNLDVPKDIWTDLLQWTFVMSRPRSTAADKHGWRVGQLSFEDFEKIYASITDEPYNVEPDQLMLSFRTRLWIHRYQPNDAANALRQATQILQRDLYALEDIMIKIERICTDLENEEDLGPMFEPRRSFIKKYLEIHSQFYLLRQSVSQLLQGQGNRKPESLLIWKREQIPQLVEEFVCHLKDSVTYKIDTGKVTLWTRPHRQEAIWDKWANLPQRAAATMGALDVDDMTALISNSAELVRRLQQHDQ